MEDVKTQESFGNIRVISGTRESPYALAIRKEQSPLELRIVAGSRAIVYDATHDYVYTADYNGPSMSVIRGTTVLATLSTGGEGREMWVLTKSGAIFMSRMPIHIASPSSALQRNPRQSGRHFFADCFRFI